MGLTHKISEINSRISHIKKYLTRKLYEQKSMYDTRETSTSMFRVLLKNKQFMLL